MSETAKVGFRTALKNEGVRLQAIARRGRNEAVYKKTQEHKGEVETEADFFTPV